MLYTILGERMTPGQVWDNFVNQGVGDFINNHAETDHSLWEEVQRYAAEVPVMFGWDAEGIAWGSDDTAAIAEAMMAHLEGLGYQ